MKSAQIIDQVDLIRQVFSYAHRFRGKTFVIHVDHAAVDDTRVTALVQDIVLLHQAGIRIVLVPGARQRIDEVLELYHVQWRRQNGVRIAGADAIPFIKMAAFDVTNRFMTLLSAHNTNAVVGNWVRARGIGVVDGVDYEHAGVVERVQLDLLRTTLRQDLIPIFPCIGWSATGKPYNISSRELAFRIAVSLEAEKLFFITDRMGLNAHNLELPPEIEATAEGRISRLTVEEARRLLERNGVSPEERFPGGGRPPAEVIEGEPRPLSSPAQPSGYHEGTRDHLEFLRLAYLAAGAGVARIHIVDGDQEGVTLAEVFSDLGVGTMVHANVYQSIRPMRMEDVGKVHNLMQPLAEQGVLLARTPEEIAAHAEDYVVHETDGRIHGCGALHTYANGEAEIAALAVDTRYEELGIGRRIVLYLMERAREQRLAAVFVLTTRTSDWFESIGFVRIGVDRLPAEKRRRYDMDRNSIILRYDFSNG
ncbi:MAG: GNAT family N-acetyltransferase [Alkalispirochaeta sp.]